MRDTLVEVAAEWELPVYGVAIPRSLLLEWAAHMERVDPANTYLQLADLGTPDEQITDVVDVHEHVATRWRAIRAHASQVSPFAMLPDDLATRFLSRDSLVALRPPAARTS
jgi:N-acetyl-1-D-myo-inositol-2-amino-2-deoxy-alpha-D-glucopyranoside deacetylase